jgi:hypothetical protein
MISQKGASMTHSSSVPPACATAVLVYDTKTGGLAAGVRAVVRRTRRVLYTAAETELVLQMTPERQPECVRLLGRIMDEGVPVKGAAVTVQGLAQVHERVTDEDGQFRIADLHAGRYDLDIARSAGCVHVADIDVG